MPVSFARVLGLVHLAYLVGLPLVGLVRLWDTDAWTAALVTGWIPVMVYVLVLLQGYRIARHPLRAAVVVAAVPVQLAAVNLLWGGGFFDFAYESAVVEVAALSIALVIAMFIHRPTGWFGVIVGVGIVAAWIPYALPLVAAIGEWPWPARLLTATALATAVWELARVLEASAGRYNQTFQPQTPELQHGTDGLAALLARDARVIEVDLGERLARGVFAGALVAFVLGSGVGVWLR